MAKTAINKAIIPAGGFAVALLAGALAPTLMDQLTAVDTTIIDGVTVNGLPNDSLDIQRAVTGQVAVGDGTDRTNLTDGELNDGTGNQIIQQDQGTNTQLGAGVATSQTTGDVPSVDTRSEVSTSSENNSTIHDGTLDDRNNEITSTGFGFTGNAIIQQNTGDNNAIGAAEVLRGHVGNTDEINQTATADATTGNQTGAGGGPLTDDGSNRANMVDQALSESMGVVIIQQNNGDGNAMSAATALTGVSGGIGVANQTATADGVARDMNIDHDGGKRENIIEDSFIDIYGRATVQQNNGNGNAINTALGGIAMLGDSGSVNQTASTTDQSRHIHSHDLGSERHNLIVDSFTDAEAVVSVQQNNGDGNSMGISNATSIDLGNVGDAPRERLELAEDGVDNTTQNATSTGIVHVADTTTKNGTSRSNEILDSFNDFTGIAAVQQNNGDANAIGAATAIAVTLGQAVQVEQTAATNGIVEDSEAWAGGQGDRSNLIDPSFKGAEGMFSVQQNNGNGNALNLATAVSYNDGGNEGVVQTVTTTGVVDDTDTLNQGDTRTNGLSDQSFQDMQGVATVQQNNGDTNVIGAAIGLIVNDGHGALTPSSQTVASTGTVSGAYAKETGDVTRSNAIDTAAFDNAAGVLTVQQNNGNNNVLGISMGLIANIFDGDSSHSEAAGTASGTSLVEDNEVLGADGQRTNTIDNAFGGAQGVMAIQQNNGDNNVMLSSTRVVGTDVTIDPFGPAASLTELNTTVSGNLSDVGGREDLSEYVNNTSDVANGSGGVFVIQQNNGSNTGMGSAISLVVNGPAISFSR
jgi:hypothetical protein